MPALATSTSQRPKRSRTASANAPTLSREEMSHSTPRLSPPRGARCRRSVSLRRPQVGDRDAMAVAREPQGERLPDALRRRR